MAFWSLQGICFLAVILNCLNVVVPRLKLPFDLREVDINYVLALNFPKGGLSAVWRNPAFRSTVRLLGGTSLRYLQAKSNRIKIQTANK
jgi:hypothetical protein